MGNRTCSSRRLGAFLTTALSLVTLVRPAVAQPAAASPSRPLTVTPGPRDGVWTRVFNPLLEHADTRWPASAGIYEPLIVYNRATGSYVPWLGARYDWRDNNTRLRFTLREGVSWSDGAPFTSRDVAFTFDLLKRFPVLDRPKMWGFLSEVTAVDGMTVDFVFKQPYTPGILPIGQQAIVAEHTWKAVANPVTFADPNPVGTGPFTEVLRFEPMVYELGRNKRYWQAGKPAVSALRVPMYHTNAEILNALEAGELDWASLFLPNIEKSWVARNPARHTYWYPDIGNTVVLYLNTQKKPFDDKTVRKAISMAIDRQRVVTEAISGYVPPADATGLPDSQKRWKDAALQSATWTQRNVAEANRLLDAAGLARGANGNRAVPGGVPMRYEIHTVAGWTDWEATAGIIAQSLAEVGIAATVVPLPYKTWNDRLQSGSFDMGVWTSTRGPTPYQFYRDQMDGALVRPIGQEAAYNFHRFASAEASRILRRFEASADPNELMTLGRELQQIYAENAPSLPLYGSALWGVFNTSVYGGFPGRARPYGGASPGQPDTLPAFVDVTPR